MSQFRFFYLAPITLFAYVLLTACAGQPRVAKGANPLTAEVIMANRLDREEGPFTWVVDTSLVPKPSSLSPGPRGPRTLAAFGDPSGVVSTFVANEIIVTPTRVSDLSGVLSFSGGVVIGDNAVPVPPQQLNRKMDPSFAVPTSYTLYVDASTFTLDSFANDSQSLGFTGEWRISSEAGARMLALVAHGKSLGFPISLNYVAESGGDMLFSTVEMTTAAGPGAFQNGFNILGYQAIGSKASVSAAWQFVSAHDIARRIYVAIIDGGFWLDTLGQPFKDSAGLSDLPANPFQYDFQGDDYVADGVNPGTCTGGSPCPWHGNSAAGVAAGTVGNSSGEAGTGGQVSDLMLFKVELTDSQVTRALRTARFWGADIVSMSFGGDCNEYCRVDRILYGYLKEFAEAYDAGMTIIAAAGNDGGDVVAKSMWPCALSIFVGAITTGSNTKLPISNYGDRVNIFAPSPIATMPEGSTGTAIGTFKSFGGTSASAPFVAGIVAMMKAMDPALNATDVLSILQSTAWTDSVDPTVSRYVNAFLAVKAAANNQLPHDRTEPNDIPGDAPTIGSTTIPKLTIASSSDVDHYRFELTDYSSIDLQLVYMTGLGVLVPKLMRDGASGEMGPSGVSTNIIANQQTYHADLMPPGSYRWVMSSAAPNFYNMTFAIKPVGLAPDMFEPNETLSTAASPGTGEFEVNHHTSLDQDYYEFELTPSSLYRFVFSVLSSDWPVAVRLFNPAGIVVQHDATTVQAPVDASGKWRIKVQSSNRGRYMFGAYQTLNLNPFSLGVPVPRREPPRRITPGDPPASSFILHGDDRFFAFQHQQDAEVALLSGEETHIVLLDAEGNLLADGMSSLQQNNRVETISLANLIPGQSYVLRVSPNTEARALGRGANQTTKFLISVQTRKG